MIHLAEHPELQDQLQNNPKLIAAAVEEYLRLYTLYLGFARTAKHDMEVGCRQIRKDEPIALVYASANRDEAVFENSDEFILNRPNIDRHLAFGFGPAQVCGDAVGTDDAPSHAGRVIKKSSNHGVAGEVVMTRWPEWGALSAPVVFVPIVST